MYLKEIYGENVLSDNYHTEAFVKEYTCNYKEGYIKGFVEGYAECEKEHALILQSMDLSGEQISELLSVLTESKAGEYRPA